MFYTFSARLKIYVICFFENFLMRFITERHDWFAKKITVVQPRDSRDSMRRYETYVEAQNKILKKAVITYADPGNHFLCCAVTIKYLKFLAQGRLFCVPITRKCHIIW